MKDFWLKTLLLFGFIGMCFLYFNYDKDIKEESVTIDNIDVETKELGSVTLIDGNLNYDINFNKVGEEFIFSFDVRNDSSFKMGISNIEITGVSECIEYKVYDINGNSVEKNLIIEKNSLKKVFVALKYAKEIGTFDNIQWAMGIDMKVSRVG